MVHFTRMSKSLAGFNARKLPDTVNADHAIWTRQGDNEQYTVLLPSRTRGGSVMVLELVWDEDNNDYNTINVDPSTVNLNLCLPF